VSRSEARFRAGLDGSDISKTAAEIVASGEIVTIDVYWNRITDRTKKSAWVTQKQITDSIAKMNSDYSSTNFQFRLVKVTTTANNQWVNMNMGTKNEKNMKKVCKNQYMTCLSSRI
jgi:hypothetical protein